MTLAVVALLGAAVVAAVALHLARVRRRALPPPAAASSPIESDEPGGPGVGDVVTVAGSDVWVRGAWRLDEDGAHVATLAFGDDATLLVTDAAVFLLREAAPLLGAGATDTVELGARFFSRSRRLPVAVLATGRAPPAPTEGVVYVEYRGADGVLLIVVGAADTWRAWTADAVGAVDVERWGRVE